MTNMAQRLVSEANRPPGASKPNSRHGNLVIFFILICLVLRTPILTALSFPPSSEGDAPQPGETAVTAAKRDSDDVLQPPRLTAHRHSLCLLLTFGYFIVVHTVPMDSLKC